MVTGPRYAGSNRRLRCLGWCGCLFVGGKGSFGPSHRVSWGGLLLHTPGLSQSKSPHVSPDQGEPLKIVISTNAAHFIEPQLTLVCSTRTLPEQRGTEYENSLNKLLHTLIIDCFAMVLSYSQEKFI